MTFKAGICKQLHTGKCLHLSAIINLGHVTMLSSWRAKRFLKCFAIWVSPQWRSIPAQTVKNLPAVWETWVGKTPWRRAWLPTPVLLPGESPWTKVLGGLQSMGLQRVGYDWATMHSTKETRAWADWGHREKNLVRGSFQITFKVFHQLWQK